MRRKLREIMDKEEGFTLVELLAVIVILGIIVAIALPAVGNIVSKSRGDAEKAEIQLIEDAGRLYLTSKEGQSVSVKTLLEEGYIEARDSEKMDTYKGENYKVEKITDENSKEISYKLMKGTTIVVPDTE